MGNLSADEINRIMLILNPAYRIAKDAAIAAITELPKGALALGKTLIVDKDGKVTEYKPRLKK